MLLKMDVLKTEREWKTAAEQKEVVEG